MKTSSKAPSGGPPTDSHSHPPDSTPSAADDKNSRLGLWLFSIYFALYAGFMGLSAFSPTTMRDLLVWGLPLSIAYGFGLIIGAIVLALLYMVLCHGEPSDSPTPKGGK